MLQLSYPNAARRLCLMFPAAAATAFPEAFPSLFSADILTVGSFAGRRWHTIGAASVLPFESTRSGQFGQVQSSLIGQLSRPSSTPESKHGAHRLLVAIG